MAVFVVASNNLSQDHQASIIRLVEFVMDSRRLVPEGKGSDLIVF